MQHRQLGLQWPAGISDRLRLHGPELRYGPGLDRAASVQLIRQAVDLSVTETPDEHWLLSDCLANGSYRTSNPVLCRR